MAASIDTLDAAGKRVLLRADLNVPMRGGAVADATRIERTAPTIAELATRGARIAVMSHLGRPRGRRVPELSLAPIASSLSKALDGAAVAFAEDCIGGGAEAVLAALPPGGVALLENLRFHAGEEANDPDFARALAALGDIYVNDAFSAAHRAHASIDTLARLLPSAAGRSMETELVALASALDRPRRPLAAVVGGAKVSTKLDLLANLVRKVDLLAIGGAMANTFLHALGGAVGASLYESGMAGTARAILARADAEGCEIVLPADVRIAVSVAPGAAAETVPVAAVPDGMMILDIGPASAAALGRRLAEARTLVWNGPLGAFETTPFDAATTAVARAAAGLTRNGTLVSVAGGGDTLAALDHAGVRDDFSHVSTAGGAFLEWLEGRTLPGIAALGA